MRVPEVEQTVTTGTRRAVAFSKARASRSPATTPMEPPRNEKSSTAMTMSRPKSRPVPVSADSASPVRRCALITRER